MHNFNIGRTFILIPFLFLGLAACEKDDVSDSGDSIVDLDADGVEEGEDCDDLDAALGSQLEDADCDGTLTEADCDDTDPLLNEVDVDADGTSTCAGDCDDADSAVYPTATEVCNGVDDDCDGLLDSDDDSVDTTDLPSWYRDTDQDGFGSEDDTISQCDQPAWYVLEQAEGFDCDDSDPDAYPGATEYCDGHDDNCDGEIDEDSAVDVLTWYSDADNDGFGYLTNSDIDCYQPSGYVADSTDCNDDNDNAYPGNVEICDGVDNDCLGDVDEDDAVDVLTWYMDVDTDGYGDPAVSDIDCYQSSGYVADNTDCDDSEITTFPGADEYCDGVDNDCDSDTDEDHALDAATWYADSDSDGYGDAAVSDIECYQPSGYIADNTDCDDSENTTFPGADEYCDGVDNDCDSDTDEDHALDAATWYADSDSDGYGDAAVSDIECYQPSGYIADNTDCDDGEASTFPGADEYCDGVDNDCDSDTDEDSAVDVLTWYADTDADGYGDSAVTDLDCDQPSGYVSDNTDCDDGDATLDPSDDDSDGYSTCDGDCDDTDSTLNLDDSDSDGWSTCDGDCDDSDASLVNDDYTLDGSTDTWTNTSGSYCDVILKNGAVLYVSGLVELSASGTFSVDATSEVNGNSAGDPAASGSGTGGYSSSGGGGGAGYGGAGGLGGYDSSDSPGAGGSTYGSSTSESIAVGSGGGNSDSTNGGAGGAAIAVWAENISIEGLISMNGETGGGGQGRNGGGGSGGGILLVGNTVSIGGSLDTVGGNGGSGSSSANDGGGGGGGGRIKVFYDSSLSYSGTYDVSGGSGGTYGSASHGASGSTGTEAEISQAYP